MLPASKHAPAPQGQQLATAHNKTSVRKKNKSTTTRHPFTQHKEKMADFLEEQEDNGVQNPAGISECLVDDRKRMMPLGLAKVDDSTDISEGLMSEIAPKAIALDVFYPLNDVDASFETLGYGQGGLIRNGKISRSPGDTTSHCTAVPVTAKRNLRIVKKKDGVYSPNRVTLNVEVGVANFDSEDIGWEPSTADEIDIREGEGSRPAVTLWGLDISIGREISNPRNPLTDPAYSFELVRPKFNLEVGQKVAIAVNFRPKAKPNKQSIKGSGPAIPGREVSEKDIEGIYGKPDCVNVYTGTITYVGKDHIEYTCNTFTGCSGAIVFLLDGNQPDSVQQCDWGKCIAVHSGSHPYLPNRNFAFKLRSHPYFSTFE